MSNTEDALLYGGIIFRDVEDLSIVHGASRTFSLCFPMTLSPFVEAFRVSQAGHIC